MPLDSDDARFAGEQVIDGLFKRIKGDAACGHDIKRSKQCPR